MNVRPMHRISFTLLTLLALAIPIARTEAQQTVPAGKPRVVITADPELDDLNTLIRALLYSGDFKIEGLIYTSSQYHWRGDGKGTTQYIPGREYTRAPLSFGPRTEWRWAENERFLDELVDAYSKVYPNLRVHDAAYPSPGDLKSKIKWGNVVFDGDYSYDTDGSNLIKSLLLDNQPGPLFVTAQGGQSTIARALKSIYEQYSKTPQWTAVRDKVSRKLVVSASGDQDGTGARYIRPNWPDVTYWQGGGVGFGYGATGGSPENAIYVSPEWTRENVSSRGLLGAMYRVWGDGKQMVKGDRTDYFGLTGLTADELRAMGYYVWTAPGPKGAFIGEGDTPTFLNFIDIGMRSAESDAFGGWGGRRRTPAAPAGVPAAGRGQAADAAPGPNMPVAPDYPGYAFGLAPAGSNANAPASAPPASGTPGGRGQAGAGPAGAAATDGNAPAGRNAAGRGGPAGAAGGAGRGGGIPAGVAAMNAAFFAAAQNDFAARLKWSVTPQFKDANHEPSVRINGARDLEARPGAVVNLRGTVSDPDRNRVATRWWQFGDADTYPGEVTIADASAAQTTFRIPDDATPGQTIHLILEARDDGTPALTRYQRVIVTVRR